MYSQEFVLYKKLFVQLLFRHYDARDPLEIRKFEKREDGVWHFERYCHGFTYFIVNPFEALCILFILQNNLLGL